jgi:hypothetical protein
VPVVSSDAVVKSIPVEYRLEYRRVSGPAGFFMKIQQQAALLQLVSFQRRPLRPSLPNF